MRNSEAEVLNMSKTSIGCSRNGYAGHCNTGLHMDVRLLVEGQMHFFQCL